jgi:diguanylate cyclase (GGDEF)-like protein
MSDVARDHPAVRIRFHLLAATFVAIAIAASLAPAVEIPRLAVFGPIFYAIAILANLATALVLLTGGRAEPARRSTMFLGVAFAAAGLSLLAVVLFLPLLPDSPAIVSSTPYLGSWLFVAWHISVAAGGLAYVIVRRFDGGSTPDVRFGLFIGAGMALFAGLMALPIAAFAGRFPLLAGGVPTSGFDRSLVGPAVIVLLGLATLALYRLREPSSLGRALAFSFLSLTLAFGLFLGSGNRYTVDYFLGRGFIAAGALVLLVTVMRALIASRAHLGVVERKLDQVESESAKRAGRIRAVWRMSSVALTSEAQPIDTILSIATAAMRPGKPMLGVLTHQAGVKVVVDATASSRLGTDADAIAGVFFPGAIYPVEQTMANQLREGGRAISWDDLAAVQRPKTVYAQHGLQSFIGAPLACAGNRFVAFVSPGTMTDEPFVEDDRAYVDVVAAFFAGRFNQQQQGERITFQREHDALTGLDNRAMFRSAVGTELGSGAPFTIALIDIDGFRHINDRYGHQIGDDLLVEVATGLRRVGNGDIIARMGSDEFGVLIHGAARHDAPAASLQRYADLFAAPFPTGDRAGTVVGASIGAARFPGDGAAAEELLHRAGLALDVAKERGGAVTMLFEQSMEAMLEATRLRELEFSAAIAGDQFAMVYQPTFTLATRAITGAEALVRWNHPTRGTIGPDAFIPFAERTGLIAALTMWVFARVSRDIASAPDLPAGFRISFNVAAPMLDDVAFIAAVNAGLTTGAGLAAHLGVEVTESAAMHNFDQSMSTIALFRRWGLPVAIDDFGTGHSSFTYLKKLAVDFVKIDRSFVTGLPGDMRGAHVTDMLLRIIDRFGFSAIAEGIENEAQADWLLAHGCRFGQGYLVAKPGSFADLLTRIGASARRIPAADALP